VIFKAVTPSKRLVGESRRSLGGLFLIGDAAGWPRIEDLDDNMACEISQHIL
jgi:hypothetical protein